MARRRGLASVLFAVARPADATGATVTATALRVRSAFQSTEIPLGHIATAKLTTGWWWGTLRIRHASGKAVVSGLSRADATALATALEGERVNWWRKTVASRIETVHSVHERVAQLAEPRRYVARSVFRDLERDARRIAGEMASRWPDSLSTVPEFRMLRAIRDLVENPDVFRVRANEAFVESELSRSRAFLDRVEARPLTDEQRRAVVVDEDRNLVVAAAGSGKTSVIVAKAGWLLPIEATGAHRNYCCWPSQGTPGTSLRSGFADASPMRWRTASPCGRSTVSAWRSSARRKAGARHWLERPRTTWRCWAC